MSTTATVTPPLRRNPADGWLGGVCAGLGPRLGLDPLVLRVAFLLGATAGGAGIALYLIAWAVIAPAEDGRGGRAARRAARDGSWRVSAGLALLVLSALLLLRALGIWFADALAWPLALAATGAALLWRRAAAERFGPLSAGARGRVALGAALVVGGGLVFLWLNDALAPARDVVLAVVVVLAAAALILAPWWLRLVRGLSAERAERIRSQERADVAAHLHDSVLQTLALMQRRAQDPRAVATLARRQERELRTWLTGGPARGSGERWLVAALEAASEEIDEAHGVAVEVVAVGDAPLDRDGEALVAAAREAMLNAAKFGGGSAVAVYAEASDERLQVFVRDRGPGFDPTAVPDDRRGVRDSIIGRMERHGGRTAINASPGGGTEVELVLERSEP